MSWVAVFIFYTRNIRIFTKITTEARDMI